MKKVINGKMYNTDTAVDKGKWWNGYSTTDFHYVYETLYQKKTGEFFLYGEGGSLSQYAQPCGTGQCGGEEIIPMTESEAKEWSEEKLDADEYIEIFGEVEE